MATLTIRNLPDDVRDRLRVAAAKQGRSIEAEARAILQQACTSQREPISEQEVDAIVKRVQAALAPYISKKVSMVDELIAQRKQEAQDEARELVSDHRGKLPDSTGRTSSDDRRS